MNLDDLQSAQSRERQTDSLQPLPESFYADAGAFVRRLREERERAAEEADDPFDSPAVRQLTDDIKTAERTVEAIYERRVGKLVKMASLAAADMPTSEEGLTAEERDLYTRLVDAIEENRAGVLSVLDGDAGAAGGEGDADRPAPDASTAPRDDPLTESTGADGTDPPRVESATERETRPGGRKESTTIDVQADETREEGAASETVEGRPDAEPDGGVGAADVMNAGGDPTWDDGPAPGNQPPGGSPEAEAPTADSAAGSGGSTTSSRGGVDRLTVRITRDVGEIFGVDERIYTLSSEDVVALPAENATPLLERDAAERVEGPE